MSSNLASHNGLSLLQASKAVGLSKVALLKAIQKGTLSAHKDDAGRWVVAASELFRVYKPLAVDANSSLQEPITDNSNSAPPANADMATRLAVMETELRLTQERLEDALKQRDLWQTQAQQLLLTDNRQKSFWQRVLGK